MAEMHKLALLPIKIEHPRISEHPSESHGGPQQFQGKPGIPIPWQHAHVGATTGYANAAVHAITYCCGKSTARNASRNDAAISRYANASNAQWFDATARRFSIATTISTTSEHVWNVWHDAATFFTSISGYEYEYWIAAVSRNCQSRIAGAAKIR